MDRTGRDAGPGRGTKAAHDCALGSPLVRLIVGEGREFGPEEWAHMLGILEGHMVLQRRQDQRAVDAAMGIVAATAPPAAEVTQRAGASPAGLALLAEFGGFDAGAWPSIRAILEHYDALMLLDTARAARPELTPLPEPLDVTVYHARKQEAPETGEE